MHDQFGEDFPDWSDVKIVELDLKYKEHSLNIYILYLKIVPLFATSAAWSKWMLIANGRAVWK